MDLVEICPTVGGIAGFATPMIAASQLVDPSTPNAGIYYGAAMALSILTGITGFHLGTKVARKISNNTIYHQNP